MIMADKIIDLRKKNGWSQEELAEQLGVSRQSVSKWEGAQSVPDMNKIIAMARLFNVSTDYLLKDEIEMVQAPEDTKSTAMDNDPPARRVSMEEANEYLVKAESSARQISFGVMLCILSPIVLILLSVAGETGRISLTEDQGSILGVIVLMFLIAGGVFLFVKNGLRMSKFDYLEKELIDTEYGVTGMVRTRKDEYEHTFTIWLTVGIILCVLSAVPVLVCTFFNENDDMLIAAGVSCTLALIAVGVWMIVRVSIVWDSFKKLLEEGDYSRIKKKSKNSVVAGIYWSLVTAGFLAYSFITMDWKHSWIVWPVAGVLFGVVSQILEARIKE